MSWFVDREKPEELQTSRVRIIVVPSDDTADVMANTGVASELPKSGIFDNVVKFAIPGLILFLVGGVFRLLLLL